jgi:acetyl-CoA C-acetyltransferase
MLAFPYAKLHTSSWNVDQAAGLLFCSAELAQALGIERSRWVFPLASTESNHMLAVSARAELHRCPAVEIAGGRAMELAGVEPSQLDYVELYSCFPVAVRLMALGLGLSLDRPLTVTGGMPFAGGPLNNYVFQATARMAELLRRDPGSTGIVTSVSGMLTKQGFGLWSNEPAAQGFRSEELSEQVARGTETRTLVSDCEGRGTIAGYTVLHVQGAPSRGIAVCDLADGSRTVAFTDDPSLAPAMTREEFCGRTVQIDSTGEMKVQ